MQKKPGAIFLNLRTTIIYGFLYGLIWQHQKSKKAS